MKNKFLVFGSFFILSSFFLFSCIIQAPTNSESEKESYKLVDKFAYHYKISDTTAYNAKDVLPILTFDDGIQMHNGFIMVGSIQVDPSNKLFRGVDGAIIGFDSNANPVWVKYARDISSSSQCCNIDEKFFKVIKLSNGNYVAISEDHLTGGGGYPRRNMIVSFTSDGKILWAKSFGRGDNLPINDIVPLSDGFLAVGDTWVHYDSYRDNNLPFDREVGIIIKFNNNGNLVFARFYAYPNVYYYPPYNYNYDDGADWRFGSAVQLGDSIYIIGHSRNSLNKDSYISALLVKIRNNGDFVWAKQFNYLDENGKGSFLDGVESVVTTRDSLILDYAYSPNGSAAIEVLLIKSDENGNFQKVIDLGDSSYYTYFQGIDIGESDTIYISTLQQSFMKFDSNLNPLLSFGAVSGWVSGEFPTNDGGGIGFSEGYPPTSPYVVKISGDYKTCLPAGHYSAVTDTTELNNNMPAVDKSNFKIVDLDKVYSGEIGSSIEIYETIETGTGPSIRKEADQYCTQK